MTTEIQLTKGHVALVSDEDGDLKKLRWFTNYDKRGIPYARHKPNPKTGRSMMMHRVILSRVVGRELLPTEECDHIDRNTLNNTRNNLRVASHSENQHNVKVKANSASGIKGVYKNSKGIFIARITANGERIYLGRFRNAEDAHKAYKTASEKYHGTFGRAK